jgi:hypothetical protein
MTLFKRSSGIDSGGTSCGTDTVWHRHESVAQTHQASKFVKLWLQGEKPSNDILLRPQGEGHMTASAQDRSGKMQALKSYRVMASWKKTFKR